METIKQVLIRRDGMTASEADDLIHEAADALNNYMAEGNHEAAENVCEEFFGLEPDYLNDLIGY